MTDVLRHPDDALSALLDGELAADEAAAVHAHVTACAECAAELDGVREARMAVRSLPAVEPLPGFLDGLLSAGPAAVGGDGDGPVGRLLSLRSRRAAVANAAAAVAVGLSLVVGFGGQSADAVSPEVDGAVERHASTVSAVSAGVGGPNPILAPGQVTPTTLPHRSMAVPRPYVAPPELAGYRLVDAFRAPKGLHLLYEKGEFALSIFEQEGELDPARLPAAGSWVRVGDDQGWRWDGGPTDGRVVVVERGRLVVVLVGDESGAAVLAAARALPGSSKLTFAARLRRACGDALDVLSPAG